MIVSLIVWIYVCVFFLWITGLSALLEGLPEFLILVIVIIIAVVSLGIIYVPFHRIIYGSFSGRPKKKVDLPNAEFHSLATCQNYGKRILNMVKDLNVGDHYIFLLNFHNLFYHSEHRLENPDSGMLNAIGRAVRITPERQRASVWTKNPFQAISAGGEAGREAEEERLMKYISDKLGAIPEPRETVSIITKEYLPDLLREFPRDVAMLIAVVVCTANNYTGVFPFDDRVVSEKDAVKVASNPTRKNVVDYCSKFAGLSVEEPVVKRKGLMED